MSEIYLAPSAPRGTREMIMQVVDYMGASIINLARDVAAPSMRQIVADFAQQLDIDKKFLSDVSFIYFFFWTDVQRVESRVYVVKDNVPLLLENPDALPQGAADIIQAEKTTRTRLTELFNHAEATPTTLRFVFNTQQRTGDVCINDEKLYHASEWNQQQWEPLVRKDLHTHPQFMARLKNDARKLSAHEFSQRYDYNEIASLVDAHNVNALMSALGNTVSSADRVEIATHLLDAGADPSLINSDDSANALHFLLKSPDRNATVELPLVRRLVEGGADPTQYSRRFNSPLTIVITKSTSVHGEKQYREFLDYFFSLDVSVLSRQARNGSAFHATLAAAHSMNYPAILHLLQAYLDDQYARGVLSETELLQRETVNVAADMWSEVSAEDLNGFLRFHEPDSTKNTVFLYRAPDAWRIAVTNKSGTVVPGSQVLLKSKEHAVAYARACARGMRAYVRPTKQRESYQDAQYVRLARHYLAADDALADTSWVNERWNRRLNDEELTAFAQAGGPNRRSTCAYMYPVEEFWVVEVRDQSRALIPESFSIFDDAGKAFEHLCQLARHLRSATGDDS